MINDNEPILLDDYQEIFWMVVTFFAMNVDNQQDTIKIFSTDYSGTLNKISSKVLGDLAECYTTYFSEVESIYEPALELYWLFKLMGTHGFYESKMDFPVAQIWSMRSLTEDDIWQLVRRMAQRVLDAWNIGTYPFDKAIDLEYLTPE